MTIAEVKRRDEEIEAEQRGTPRDAWHPVSVLLRQIDRLREQRDNAQAEIGPSRVHFFKLLRWSEAAPLRSVTISYRSVEQSKRGTHPDAITVSAWNALESSREGMVITANGSDVEEASARVLDQIRGIAKGAE